MTRVIVDTSVWSMAMRRKPDSLCMVRARLANRLRNGLCSIGAGVQDAGFAGVAAYGVGAFAVGLDA